MPFTVTEGQQFTIPVTRSGGSSGRVAITWITQNVNVTPSHGRITWEDGETGTRNISLTAGLVETTQEGTITLSNARRIDGRNQVAAPTLGATFQDTITIQPITQDVGVVSLTTTSIIVNEGSNATITAIRNSGTVGDIAVDWTVSGELTTPISGVFNWPEGDSAPKSASVLANLVASTENGTVTLSNPRRTDGGSPAPTLGVSSGALTVNDVADPDPPPPSSPQREPTPLGDPVIHSGHSLVDIYMNVGGWPGLISRFLEAYQAGLGVTHKRSVIPGSSMEWRWQNPSSINPPYDDDARTNIANYKVLLITENNSLINSQDAHQWFLTWCQHAWANGDGGNGAETILYACWRGRDDVGVGSWTAWRGFLDSDDAGWQAKADLANANVPTGQKPVFIMPGHQIWARIYDDIQAGLVPGVSNIQDLFSDGVHPNVLGAWPIMLAQVLMIHHLDIREIDIRDVGQTPTVPTVAQHEYFRNVVWEVLHAYEGSGLRLQEV